MNVVPRSVLSETKDINCIVNQVEPLYFPEYSGGFQRSDKPLLCLFDSIGFELIPFPCSLLRVFFGSKCRKFVGGSSLGQFWVWFSRIYRRSRT